MLRFASAYIHFRAALASAVGLAVLVAGVAGAGRRGSDLVWFLLVFFACQIVAVVLVRRVRRAEDDARYEQLLASRREKLRVEGDTRVVGKRCVACDQRIVVEHDGEPCAKCNEPVHLACSKGHVGDAHRNTLGGYR